MADLKCRQGSFDNQINNVTYRFGRALRIRDMSCIVDLNDELIGDGWEFRFALNTRDRNSSKGRIYTKQKHQRFQALHDD